jgi:hypothetical protein
VKSAHKREMGQVTSDAGAQEPATSRERGNGSYVLEWVNCGNPYCRKCAPGGQGAHGPYWYVYLWRNGKHLKRYVGKNLPQSAVDLLRKPHRHV